MEREAIQKWVRDHKVTWEISPWKEVVEKRPTAVGFELRLFARHDVKTHASPGCDQCVHVYETLREIAHQALPQSHRPTRYDIDPFDAKFHLRPQSEWTPEVQLAIHIVHREDYLGPLDECEKQCAEEIEHGLEALGVQPKTWSDLRARTPVRS